jgi:hypothetical protein
MAPHSDDVSLFSFLCDDLMAEIVVKLNDGPISTNTEPRSGYLYPGYQGGRELHYYSITRDTDVFMNSICKVFKHGWRLRGVIHAALTINITPTEEMYQFDVLPDFDEWDRISYVPIHFYTGNYKKTMLQLCYELEGGVMFP